MRPREVGISLNLVSPQVSASAPDQIQREGTPVVTLTEPLLAGSADDAGGAQEVGAPGDTAGELAAWICSLVAAAGDAATELARGSAVALWAAFRMSGATESPDAVLDSAVRQLRPVGLAEQDLRDAVILGFASLAHRNRASYATLPTGASSKFRSWRTGSVRPVQRNSLRGWSPEWA